jgi:hypothetical protein
LFIYGDLLEECWRTFIGSVTGRAASHEIGGLFADRFPAFNAVRFIFVTNISWQIEA